MRRFSVLGLLLALVVATPAWSGDIGVKKQAIDAKIATLHQTLAAQQGKEAAMRAAIAGVSSRIRVLDTQVGDVSLHLQTLQQDLSLRKERLDKLNQLFRLQTQRFSLLKQEYALSVSRLNRRLVAIFESQDVSTLDVVLGSTSIEDALDASNYMTRIGQEDRHVAQEVSQSKNAVRLARAKTATIRRTIEGEARALAARATQEAENRNALLGAKGSLDAARQQKLVALGGADLAVAGADHQPVRLALGPDAPGDRHRSADRYPDPRRRGRQGHLLRLGTGVRQLCRPR